MPDTTPSLTLHGVFMRVHEIGVLLTGASGVGKSELALELLARGHQLIADDTVDFSLRQRSVIGRAPRLLRGFLEAPSPGLLNIAALYGARNTETPRVGNECGMTLSFRWSQCH